MVIGCVPITKNSFLMENCQRRLCPRVGILSRSNNVVINLISHLETSDTINLNTFDLIDEHEMFANANKSKLIAIHLKNIP